LLLAREFERSGAARMIAPIDPEARNGEPVLYSNHHLGTTRMSEERGDGVVNPDCRVHDISNLYIIGGSVFATVSWANPTFTLLALTLRLADHLSTRIFGWGRTSGAS
jgi:choline dehydrogenase-like flavoprotein